MERLLVPAVRTVPNPKTSRPAIEILHPGDDVGNGLVRHCYFPVPWWLGSGASANRGSGSPRSRRSSLGVTTRSANRLWSHATGWTLLEPIADRRTRATFIEQYEAFNPIMRVLLEKRVHEGLSRDNDTILAALNGGLAWHRRRRAKSEQAAPVPPEG